MNLKSIFGILCLVLIMMSCGSDDTEKFIGNWSGDINCFGDVESISVVVAAGAEDDQIIFTVDNSPPSITGTVNGDNVTLDTVREDEGDGDYTDIGGGGSINSDGNLIMSFDIAGYEDGALDGSGTCTATLSM